MANKFGLLLCIVLVTFLAVNSQGCPVACDCLGTIVDCSERNLKEIPTDLPAWTEELDLSLNSGLNVSAEPLATLVDVKKLTLNNLGLEEVPDVGNLTSLRYLSMIGNRLRSRPDSPFQNLYTDGLSDLRELDVSHNYLHTFDIQDFNALPALRKLTVSRNGINNVVIQKTSPFGNLKELRLSRNLIDGRSFKNMSQLFSSNAFPELRVLDLNRNRIDNIPSLSFQSLSKLKTLKLKRNELRSFNAGVFYGLTEIEVLQLDFNKLTSINESWLYGLESLLSLSLSNNEISQIHMNAWARTLRLEVLDLSGNRLNALRETLFKGLTYLKELHLSHNQLDHLDANSLSHLTRLHTLNLSYNNLIFNIENRIGAFNGLKNLKKLSLGYNSIERIHEKVFRPLKSLEYIDLLGNELKGIPDNPFHSLKNLTEVYIHTSSLVCDCKLQWFSLWLSQHNFNHSVSAKCDWPEIYEGYEVKQLKSYDFVCNGSPSPVITSFPPNQTKLFGEILQLDCIAQAGHDRPSFQWYKGIHTVDPFNIKSFESIEVVNQMDLYNITSRLIIENVTLDDNGDYQCVVRNSFGPDYSPVVRVDVYKFPYFTLTPQSIIVRIGDTAKLPCAASGVPKPVISWTKLGENEFPAAIDRRLHLMTSDNESYIKPVQLEDEGEYMCIARNKAGANEAHINITVIYSPYFIKEQTDQIVKEGQSAVLECQGKGKPDPKVTWTLEGVPVVEDDTHIMLRDGQFLVVLQTFQSDAGQYKCELTNILGTVRRHISLNLDQDSTYVSVTFVIILTASICCILSSIIWLCFIYFARRKISHLRKNVAFAREVSRDAFSPCYPPHMNATPLLSSRANGEVHHALAPLLAPSDAFNTSLNQDSGSEHSSGKDSGVGELGQRSSEDLQRGVLPSQMTSHGESGLGRLGPRRSLVAYDDFSSDCMYRGQSSSTLNSCDPILRNEETRPRLSTFGSQGFSSQSSHNPYASLRRGSSSRLTAVPSPMFPARCMATLPRHFTSRPSLRVVLTNNSSSSSSAHLAANSSPRSMRGERPRDSPPPVPSTEKDEDYTISGSNGGGTEKAIKEWERRVAAFSLGNRQSPSSPPSYSYTGCKPAR